MFEVGQLIVYGNTGVCRVKEITTMDFDEEEGRLYYKLEPLFQDCSIATPADNPKVFMRPILTREEAEQLIDTIPTREVEAFHSHTLREVAEHYEAAINAHDCAELVELTMSIYAKKKYVERHNRKFGSVDEHFMKRAEELLFGELSASLGIPKEQVPKYIAQRIKTIQDKEAPVNPATSAHTVPSVHAKTVVNSATVNTVTSI